MPDYFLLLKLAAALNADTANGSTAARDKFVAELTDEEAEALPAQVAQLGKEAARLLDWRKWKAENRQPELVIS